MNGNRNRRTGISLLLSFFLALSFFGLSAGIAIKSSYLPGNLWSRYLFGSSYGNESAEAAYEQMEKLFDSRNLLEEAAGEMFTREALFLEYGYCVDDILQKKTQKNRREIFEEKLEANVMEYLQEAAMTEQLEQEIGHLVQEAGDIYDSYLNPGWLVNMMSFSDKYSSALNALIVLSLVIIIIGCIVLWLMHNCKYRAVCHIIYGAGTSCLWGMLAVLFLWSRDWVGNLGVGPEWYCQFIGGLWGKVLEHTIIILLIEAMVVLALLLWMKYLKRGTH